MVFSREINRKVSFVCFIDEMVDNFSDISRQGGNPVMRKTDGNFLRDIRFANHSLR